MNDFNSQEFLEDGMSGFEETGGGEREGVVDSQQSQYGEDDYDFDGDGQEEVVDPQEEGADDEGSEEGENDPAAAGQDGAKHQTREDNAAARAARLRAERETEARMRRQMDEEIARSGMKDPVTGKPIRSMQELKEASEAQREAEIRAVAKRTGRSVEEVREDRENKDLLEELKQGRRAQANAAKLAAEQEAFLREDGQAFVAKYPDVDIAKLEQNANFRKFCGSRFGREPLAELYESYVEITGAAASAGRAGAESRSRRSTGSGGGGGEMLSPSQRAALAQWNRENPDMKMTAKEFLGR